MSFFTQNQPRQFQMNPRYYSEEKERIEELKRRIGEEGAEEEQRTERIRDAFDRRRPSRNQPHNKVLSGTRIIIYVLVIIALVLFISNPRWFF